MDRHGSLSGTDSEIRSAFNYSSPGSVKLNSSPHLEEHAEEENHHPVVDQRDHDHAVNRVHKLDVEQRFERNATQWERQHACERHSSEVIVAAEQRADRV